VVQFQSLNPSTPSVSFGTPRATIGQQVRLYADPASLVGVSAVRSGLAGTADFEITISGYLVDLP
ncbi:MAG TPA: hypothetical protein VGV87_01685, partial [Blastocatellia bacterium]|nr:hypothetical protein [Blastocatellia bacterium]